MGLSVPCSRQQRSYHRFYLSPRHNSKAIYRYMGKLPNNTTRWQMPRIRAGAGVTEARKKCPSDVEHRQIKYRNSVIECDHSKLKRIINATQEFIITIFATVPFTIIFCYGSENPFCDQKIYLSYISVQLGFSPLQCEGWLL